MKRNTTDKKTASEKAFSLVSVVCAVLFMIIVIMLIGVITATDQYLISVKECMGYVLMLCCAFTLVVFALSIAYEMTTQLKNINKDEKQAEKEAVPNKQNESRYRVFTPVYESEADGETYDFELFETIR